MIIICIKYVMVICANQIMHLCLLCMCVCCVCVYVHAYVCAYVVCMHACMCVGAGDGHNLFILVIQYLSC